MTMKPDTIRRYSPPPVEYADLKRPRSSILISSFMEAGLRRAKQAGRTRGGLLRDLWPQQDRVETQIRRSDRASFNQQRAFDEIANERERRRRPMFISELYAQLRAKMAT
jgi:hypothetical protein